MSVTNNNQNNTKKEDQMCEIKYNIFEQAYETTYGVKIPAFIDSEHVSNTLMRQEYYDDDIGPALSLSDLETEDDDTEELNDVCKLAANQIPYNSFNMANSSACLNFYENDEELRIACRTINQMFTNTESKNSLMRSTGVKYCDEIDASEIKFDLDKYRNKCSKIDDEKFWENFVHYEDENCEEEYINDFCDNTDIDFKEMYAASMEMCIKKEN